MNESQISLIVTVTIYIEQFFARVYREMFSISRFKAVLVEEY